MFYNGFVGGDLGEKILHSFAHQKLEEDQHNTGARYYAGSKLEALFGDDVWDKVQGKEVLDYGCGFGAEAIEIAQRGAERVIGIDSRQRALDRASLEAARAGVARRCEFTRRLRDKADIIFSIDGFEHYDDPEQILESMHRMLKPGGKVLISLGPPWFHPYGGHLFSVFPWAHLVFSEEALIQWRSEFKTDGATCFKEVEGGLNQMTVKQFRTLVENSDFEVDEFEAVPIRSLSWLKSEASEEYLTSIVRCTLSKAA